MESVAQVLALAIDHERLTVEQRAREAERCARRAGGSWRRRPARAGRWRRISTTGRRRACSFAAMQLGQAAADAGGPQGEQLQRARREIDEAINELRRVANGLAPSLLVERGLYAAVDDLIDRMPLRSRLEVSGPMRILPWSVASGAYFIVSEAIANVLKHAEASTTVARLEREARAAAHRGGR